MTAQPDWIAALRKACKTSSQTAIAHKLHVSPATISLLLKGTYTADTARMEARVRGELMQKTCTCPVLGEMSTAMCQEEQRMGYYPNPIRGALYKACKTCLNAIRKEKP